MNQTESAQPASGLPGDPRPASGLPDDPRPASGLPDGPRSDAATDLGRLLVSLGGSISDEDDLMMLLDRLVHATVGAIEGADCAGVTIDLGGRLYTAVHTDERTLAVDADQYSANDGPCLEAARTGEVVRVDVDESAARWPAFTAAAQKEGIHSFLAAPLMTAETSLGALNLYGARVSAFENVDAAFVEMLTRGISRSIADFARYRSATEVADQLREAMSHRAPIEQAKGILMAMHRVDAEAAFSILREQSQSSNRKLRDIAADVVSAFSAANGKA